MMTGTMLSPSMSGSYDLNGACMDYNATLSSHDAGYSNHVTTRCSHCDYVAHSAQEMTQHRWDVHPLLTRHKQHLMTSPKESRKRPNSESSEEKFSPDVEWMVPRKKLSPAHNFLTSCDGDFPVLDHVRRTRSADEVLKKKSKEVRSCCDYTHCFIVISWSNLFNVKIWGHISRIAQKLAFNKITPF